MRGGGAERLKPRSLHRFGVRVVRGTGEITRSQGHSFP